MVQLDKTITNSKINTWSIKIKVFSLAVINENIINNFFLLINQYQFQFWYRFIPVNGGGWIYPTLAAIPPTPTLHLTWFNASSFFKPTLLLSFSTCIFHVFLGRPRFLFPFTLNSNTFLKTCPSSLLNTCPYGLLVMHLFTFIVKCSENHIKVKVAYK